jgi:hypothetical protein
MPQPDHTHEHDGNRDQECEFRPVARRGVTREADGEQRPRRDGDDRERRAHGTASTVIVDAALTVIGPT